MLRLDERAVFGQARMTPLRIAFAGAGGVIENFYLPAAQLCPEVRVMALADKNLERARTLASRFGVPKITADYHELYDAADAVVIALPNFLHAPAAIDFLRQGMSVVVEKPMALHLAEAEKMIQAARLGKAILAPSLVGRHASGARWIKRALTEGLLGSLKSFEVEYGSVFSWQLASSFLFSKEQAGGGVLIDLGSHMLDLVIWWMGKPTLIEYSDDSTGGVEAECSATLSFADAKGSVSLSRLRRMTNTVRLSGERRVVEWDIATDTVRAVSSTGDPEAELPGFPQLAQRPLIELFAEQLRAFACAVVGAGEPTASGESVLTVVDLIERCYRERRRLERPWTKPILSVAEAFPVKQALILGAVNPVGCRLAEALCEDAVSVVALVDDWVQAPRLARLPVRMIEGRVADEETLKRAMADCDVVFHCMEYDRRRGRPALRDEPLASLKAVCRRLVHKFHSAFSWSRRNMQCVEAMLSAASRSGITRVVFLNAAAVPTASERAALRYQPKHGLSVIVLRPATVYGPFCFWTVDSVDAIRRGRRPQVGAGPSLYVDHLVEAMLLAAATDAGAEQVFSLYDEEPASCEELFEAHGRCISAERTSANCAAKAATRKVPRLDTDIEQAQRVLGYKPQDNFTQNMERTAAWLEWSRL